MKKLLCRIGIHDWKIFPDYNHSFNVLICKRCPRTITRTVMEIEFSSKDTVEEKFRKQLEFEKELNRKLINGLEIYNKELRTIAEARHLSADELREYAFECLLRYGIYKG